MNGLEIALLHLIQLIWIHEGLQVYSESIFFEDKFNSYEVGVHYLNTIKNRIVNEIPIVGNENENHWALHGDTI